MLLLVAGLVVLKWYVIALAVVGIVASGRSLVKWLVS
jgi:hypothetical protein